MGTPEFAVPSLGILLENNYEIPAVVTVPDKPKGRGLQMQFPAVKKFANENNVEMIVFKPDFEKFGRGAALARNTQIIQKSDVVFAFWDGKSKGTHDSIKKAEKLNKRLLIFNY